MREKIEEVVSKYSYILPDTCAIISFLDCSNQREFQKESMIFWKEKIIGYPKMIYFDKKIIHEIRYGSKYFLEFKDNKDFLDLLWDNSICLDKSEKDLFLNLHDKYLKFKPKKLSGVDYSLLISSIVLTSSWGNSVLVSNDFLLANQFYLVKKEVSMDSEFYFRTGMDDFQKGPLNSIERR